MQVEFPDAGSQFLKPADFQDNPTTLTFQGWERKHNEDDPAERKNGKKWKDKIKYQLSYSYPEWAIDPTTGEKRVGSDGEPFRNSNWLPEFPHGYSIVYKFDEGELETGSAPLWRAFCRLKPKAGESVVITRTGVDKETKWSLKREKVTDGFVPSEDVPF